MQADGWERVETAGTHKRQLGNDNTQDSKQVNNEISQVVMCVMSADEEQGNGNAQKEFFGRRVLGAIVDLLPHIEVVKGAAVEVEGNATDVVEHDVGAKHVGHVGQCPRGLLGDAGKSIVDNFAASDQDNVDSPGTCQQGSCQRAARSEAKCRMWRPGIPLALVQLALRLGREAWSLICSRVSGGSW